MISEAPKTGKVRGFAKPEDLDKRPAWQIARERQQDTPAHQKLVERDAKRGTNRDMYLLNDRIFQATHNYKIKGVVGYAPMRAKTSRIPVLRGGHPMMIDRRTAFWDSQEIEQNVRKKRKRRRAKAARKHRQDQRRRVRRGAHAR